MDPETIAKGVAATGIAVSTVAVVPRLRNLFARRWNDLMDVGIHACQKGVEYCDKKIAEEEAQERLEEQVAENLAFSASQQRHQSLVPNVLGELYENCTEISRSASFGRSRLSHNQ